MRKKYLKDSTIAAIADTVGPDGTLTHDARLDALLPHSGISRDLMYLPTRAVEGIAFSIWGINAALSAIGLKPYGLKEISGRENLESIVGGEGTMTLLPPHITEVDYGHGAYSKFALGLEGHFVAGRNLLEAAEGKGQFKKFLLNSAFDDYRIIRIDRDKDLDAFRKIFKAVHSAGGNTIVYPGATRDRTNSDFGDLGKGFLAMLTLMQRDIKEPVFAVPVSVTYDQIFRAPQKVRQLVTGYERQGAEQLGSLILPMLWDVFAKPMYVHVGNPINVKALMQENEKAAPRKLVHLYNERLIDGIYATPLNVMAATISRECGYCGDVSQLAKSISETLARCSIDPKHATTHQIELAGRANMGKVSFSRQALRNSVGDTLDMIAERGVHTPRLLQGATPDRVLKLAGKGMDHFAARTPGGDYDVRDPLVMKYYAGALNARLAHQTPIY